LDVTILDRQRGRRVARRALARFVERLVERVPAPADSVAVSLVSDRRMSELNRRFRGKPGATDVLSFGGEPQAAPAGERDLGDIVISVPTAARQAALRGHSLGRELRILSIHGYLHLLGHDHEADGGTMRRLERRLIDALLPRKTARRPR